MPKARTSTGKDDWDLDSAQLVKPSSRSNRVVFSVQFSAEEFAVVSRRARMAGLKPGAYIRQTVLECGTQNESAPMVTTGSYEASSQSTFSGGFRVSMTQPSGQIEGHLIGSS